MPIKQRALKWNVKMTKMLTTLHGVSSEVSSVADAVIKNHRTVAKRSKAITAFDNAATVVEQAISQIKTIPSKPRGIGKKLQALLNNLNTVSEGITDGELSRPDTIEIINQHIRPKVSEIDNIHETLLQKQEKEDAQVRQRMEYAEQYVAEHGTSLEGLEGADLLNAIRMNNVMRDQAFADYEEEITASRLGEAGRVLSKYRVHEKRLVQPKSPDYQQMLDAGICLPVQCPVFVTFTSPKMREPEILHYLGFKQTPISSRSSNTPDVALVLEDQLLFQFSKDSALKLAQKDLDDKRQAINKGDDAKAVRRLRKRIRENTQKANDLDSSASKTTGHTRDLILKRVRDIMAELERDEKQLKELEFKVKERRRLHGHQKKALINKSAVSKRQSGNLALDQKGLENRVRQYLEHFASHGQEYSCLSVDFVAHPTMADVLLAWVVPADTADVIRQLYANANDNVVTNWGLPWKLNV